jgi:hypothetical protein
LQPAARGHVRDGVPRLTLENLVSDDAGVPAVRGLSLQVQSRDILGIPVCIGKWTARARRTDRRALQRESRSVTVCGERYNTGQRAEQCSCEWP